VVWWKQGIKMSHKQVRQWRVGMLEYNVFVGIHHTASATMKNRVAIPVSPL